MTTISKSFDNPDQHVTFSRGSGQVVTIEGITVARGRLEPGWRWSNDIQSTVGTPSCRLEHRGVVMSGTLQVETDDGGTTALVAGDAFVIPAGHDAWVVGQEPVVTIEWEGADRAAELWKA